MQFGVSSTLLDACVLSVLHKGDAYGYSLTQDIVRILEVSESTLYPVLKRLQKEMYLTTYDSPFQGRNRRYYKITEKGEKQVDRYKHEWADFKEKVDIFLGGRDE